MGVATRPSLVLVQLTLHSERQLLVLFWDLYLYFLQTKRQQNGRTPGRTHFRIISSGFLNLGGLDAQLDQFAHPLSSKPSSLGLDSSALDPQPEVPKRPAFPRLTSVKACASSCILLELKKNYLASKGQLAKIPKPLLNTPLPPKWCTNSTRCWEWTSTPNTRPS